MNRAIICLSIFCLTSLNTALGQHQKPVAELSSIAKGLEWKGIAIQDDNYTIWGCAPIARLFGKRIMFRAVNVLESDSKLCATCVSLSGSDQRVRPGVANFHVFSLTTPSAGGLVVTHISID